MGVYKKAVITEAGEALAARAVSGEVTIQFSHSGTSSYAYSEGTNLKKLTELQDVKQTVIPSNVQIANDTLISIRSMFDNSEITQEYLIQNVGIYASDGETEILFAVCQAATPDQMPAFNGVAPSSFIYNVQISIAQAEQLSISISTAGTATVQDVLDLEKKMEEKKLDSSGGDASDTVASVEEPNSEEEKYPDIGSKGSMKNILGNLYRWVKTLKADKVDSAGGDTAETVISAFEASSENFPVPAVKEKAKTRWGKVKKFCEDFKAWMTGVCLLGHIVNNCVTNNPNLPLSAAQGKALMDLYTVLNTNTSKIGHTHDERYYTEEEIENKLYWKAIGEEISLYPESVNTDVYYQNDKLKSAKELLIYHSNFGCIYIPNINQYVVQTQIRSEYFWVTVSVLFQKDEGRIAYKIIAKGSSENFSSNRIVGVAYR